MINMGSTGKGMHNVLGGQLRIEENNNRLLVSKNNIDMLLIGQDAVGAIVVKVAKDGFDVKTTGNANLIFNSAQNVFKIVKTVSSPFPTDTLGAVGAGQFAQRTTTTAIPHGLGIIPAFLPFLATGGGTEYVQTPYRNEFGSGANFAFVTYYITTDINNVYFNTMLTVYGTAAQSSFGLNGKVFLLQETAN